LYCLFRLRETRPDESPRTPYATGRHVISWGWFFRWPIVSTHTFINSRRAAAGRGLA
jgi:hypothetical protein